VSLPFRLIFRPILILLDFCPSYLSLGVGPRFAIAFLCNVLLDSGPFWLLVTDVMLLLWCTANVGVLVSFRMARGVLDLR